MTLLIALAVSFLVLMWYVARGQGTPVRQVEELEGRTFAVDLAAFRNLANPAETEYLRRRLSARQFRAVDRLRKRAAIDYLSRTAHNAALLLRLGQAAHHSDIPAVAAAGGRLTDTALRVRISALLAILQLWIAIFFPFLPFSFSRVISQYEQLRDSLMSLGYLQQPAAVSRICEVL